MTRLIIKVSINKQHGVNENKLSNNAIHDIKNIVAAIYHVRYGVSDYAVVTHRLI